MVQIKKLRASKLRSSVERDRLDKSDAAVHLFASSIGGSSRLAVVTTVGITLPPVVVVVVVLVTSNRLTPGASPKLFLP